MKKDYRYYNYTYGRNIRLLINATPEEAQAFCRKKYGLKASLDIGPSWWGGAFDLRNDKNANCGLFIWIREFSWSTEDYVSLSHECQHIAEYIFSLAGIGWDNHDSAHCLNYLQNAIYLSFLNQLNSERKKDDANLMGKSTSPYPQLPSE